MKKGKRYFGITVAALLAAAFVAVALMLKKAPVLEGAFWYLASSVQRLLFALLALLAFMALYKKKPEDIFHVRNLQTGLAAGKGFEIFFLFYFLMILVGMESLKDLPVEIILSQLLLQQLTTAVWEELAFRGLVLEGYFHQENKTAKMRLLYASVSFVLFGLIHVVDCDSVWSALYQFAFTGIIGFSFAVIYLRSHNILIPMVFHFCYDFFANLAEYVQWKESTVVTVLNYLFLAVFIFTVLPISIAECVKETKRHK